MEERVPALVDLVPPGDVADAVRGTDPLEHPEAPVPQAYICSRCGQPSDHPLCDACQEAFSLLRALSGLE